MITYIALLRGINVSGKNILKMADLKQLFVDLGFSNVTTYIQSGNIIFMSQETNIAAIETQIFEGIKQLFGYSVKVLIITNKQLKIVYTSNLFLLRESIDITKLHVTFLKGNYCLDEIKNLEKLISTTNEEFKIIANWAYLYLPNGAGKAKLTNNLFEKKLKTTATSRNWRTITKLVELSDL